MYMSAYVPHFSSSGDVQAWDLFVLLTGLLFGFSEVASSFSVEFVTLHFSLALIYNTSTGYQEPIFDISYRPGQPNWDFWLWIFQSVEIQQFSYRPNLYVKSILAFSDGQKLSS